MIDRRRARILAMQALCQFETLGNDFDDQLDAFLADESPPEDVQRYAGELTRRAWRERRSLDRALRGAAEHWDPARMGSVDRNVLRVAVCELRSSPDVPPRVAVNEAIEIGKAFGSADSGRFINGVLDALLKKRRSDKTSDQENAEATNGAL